MNERGDTPFPELLQRVRAGDAEAAAELVRRYEPEIRRAIRVRLTDRRLHRTLDSMDICQSVLAQFFVRIVGGQFELDRPAQLLQLLITMARNKLLDHARYQQAERRDVRRNQSVSPAVLAQVADAGATPSQRLAGRELLEAVRRALTEEERYLAEQRCLGRDWAVLATELGCSAEALRKRLTRALDRVCRQLETEGNVT